jgi:quercetin dioxygenase-like cupin family protein
MKKIKMISKSLLIGFTLILCSGLYAQDPMEVAPNVYKKVILDNEKVRVFEVEFAPGDVAPWHFLGEHVGYVVSGGKMEMTEKGKEPMVMDIKDGDAMYMPAITHMVKNVGNTTVKMIVTEMKSGHHMKTDDSSMENDHHM